MKPIKWILLVALLGLAFGQSASSIEPGFCISGSKINDCTGEGLPGWTINLKDESGAVIDTTVTDANGDYSFCGLAPGTYTVCEVPKAGWTPVGDTCIPVTLEDVDVAGVDFSNTPFLCISGSKINDCTGEGLPGWTINLKDESGAVIDTTMTDANGDYSFCGLAPGTYTVCETQQAGWTPVSDDCIDVALVNIDIVSVDFSNSPLLCISGSKINDCTGEGLPGWTVNLKDESGAVIDTTMTDANGDYSFCGLAPGTYTVCGVSMAGWEPVGPECVDVALESEDSTDINFYNAPSNHCPVTEDISYDTAKNKPITVSHAGTDEDGDTLTVAIETQPDHGTVVLNSDNTFTYTQTDHFFCGEDSFTYTVSDGKCDPVIGTITINVECPQDDAPGQTGENPGLSGDTGQGHDTIPGHTKRK